MKKINKGAAISAKRSRKRAIKKYQLNPQICKFCHGCILILGKQKTSDTRKKIFCSRTCIAKFNNEKRYHNKNGVIKRLKFQFRYGKCEQCDTIIKYTRNKSGTFYKRKYCDSCRFEITNSVEFATKKELYDKRKNWQSARSSIRNHAYKIFYKSNKEKKCSICGYQKHIEIAHKISVSSFPDDTLISTINNINNLIALCPNHHWEFDNGILNNLCAVE